MRTPLTLAFLFSVALVGTAAEVRSDLQQRPVWYWQARGNAQRMRLQVRLDNKTIFTTTLSIANRGRSAIPRRSYGTKIGFSFRPQRSIVWSEYRDGNVLSQAKQRIKCDIWMAGADENAIILGVSCDAADTILMNTLHLASPTTEVRSEIAGGLAVVTSPITATKPHHPAAGKAGMARLLAIEDHHPGLREPGR